MLDASGFKGLLHSCFMSPQRCADYLGVSLRTVQNWIAGTRRVPWSVVRLLRLHRRGELGALHDRWEGWYIRDDAIYSPAGKPFRFELMHAFFNTVERARLWQLDYERRNPALADFVTRPETLGEASGCGGEAPADTLLISEPAKGASSPWPATLPAIQASTTPSPTTLVVLPIAGLSGLAAAMVEQQRGEKLQIAGAYQAPDAMLEALLASLQQGLPQGQLTPAGNFEAKNAGRLEAAMVPSGNTGPTNLNSHHIATDLLPD